MAIAASLVHAVCVLLFLAIAPLTATAASVSGTARDSTSAAPVEAASVFLRDAAETVVAHTVSGANGEFAFAQVPAGRYTLGVTHLGYERASIAGILLTESETRIIDLKLVPSAIQMNPIVITASRRAEKMLDSPAPMTVVTRRTIEERATVSPSGHLHDVPGVQVRAITLGQDAVSVRGLGSVMSRDLHVLSDYRLAGLPTPRVAMMEHSTADDDLDRIEVVRGPGAALYGPNADRGVVHLISKSPFENPGTTLRLGGGEREVGTASFRHAAMINSSWAYRLSGRYFRGLEWPYIDPVEAARRSAALAAGANPATLRTGLRDPISERFTLDARGDWRLRDRTSVTFAAGATDDAQQIGTSDAGALQLDGWIHGFGQVRVTHDRLFAQAYVNLTDSGDSYFIRNGAPVINKSRLLAAQIQHGATIHDGADLVYGLDAKRTEPRTERSLHNRYENDDTIDEIGAYVHSETRILPQLRGIAALRIDQNNRIEDAVFSPRAALQYRVANRQSLRLAYNRAYGTPDASDFFFDAVLDSLPIPMAVRAAGTPETGFTFRRDANGPMIRSPFTPPAFGGPFAFLTRDVTPFWPVIVGIMGGQGVDLSSIPAPTASDVSTNLLLVDPQAGTAELVTDVEDIDRLRPTITNNLELGYQGWIGGRFRFEGSAYRAWIEDFISRFRNITPNAFLDRGTLEAYLIANGVSPAAATAYAAQIAQIPLGTVTPEQAFDPADILIASRNFGTIQFWGADGSFAVQITEPWSVSGTISWLSRDLFPNLDGVDDVALNAPTLRGTLSLQFRDAQRIWGAMVRVRAAKSYPFQSGIYSGRIGAHGLLDFALVYKPPGLSGTSFLVAANNVLDDRYLEFVGGPEFGRVALFQLRHEF